MPANCIWSVHLQLDTNGSEEPNLVVEVDEFVCVSAESASCTQVSTPRSNRMALDVRSHSRSGAELEGAATLTEFVQVSLDPANERRNIFTEKLGSPGAPCRCPLREIADSARGERT